MSAFEILDKSGNYQEQLTMADLNSLPMGIKRTFGNVEYTVAVSRMRTGHSYAELTIYGRIKIPQGENKVLFFGAQGIKFSYDGDFHGDCKLMLLSDVDIPINGDRAELILHGGFDNATGQGVEKTFFTMDCSGFKELNIVADVVFPESLIRKVGDNGEPVSGEAGRVSAPFHTVVSDWNDILVSLSVPRFEITGLDGFIFDVKNAVFDFSDSRNEAGIQFPDGYENGYLVPGNTDLWRGVYIRELSVVLPPQFAIRESSQRISFAANNMLLDNNGVSGLFEADNILPIESGSAGGWRFSVDRFSMTLEASQIVGAGFAGYIGLPVSEVSELAYEAFISPDNEYLLKVQPAKDIAFDVWSARAEILANSYVKMEVIDGRFRPEALLNGSLSISAKQNEGGKSIAELESVKFTGLHLQTVAPYIEVQSMGYSGEMKLKNFPLSISKIELTAAGDEAKLAFDAKLSLVGDKVPITADTRLELVGAISESGGIQRLNYRRTDVSKIALDVTMASAFSLKGGLTLLDDDPVYGDGFAGDVELKLSKGINVEVKVRAIFGNTDFRYWFVDGAAKFPGILVAPPAIKLNGFGGGAYYKMKPHGAGSMPTGTNYVPDRDSGLGIKAAVMFNIGSESLIQGESLFEIAFNSNGGLNFIGFYGQAKFLGKIPGVNTPEKFVSDKFKGIAKKEAEYISSGGTLAKLEKLKMNNGNEAAQQVFESSENPGESGLLAALGIQYDFTNNSLHAQFDVYANVAKGMLRGVNAGNHAGKAVFHVEPGKWYLHLGTPTNPLGVEFNLANIVRMQTKSYFMAGHDIPGSPAPPQQVADILGMELRQLDYMRDLNSLGDGHGLAFGSHLSISTGDITFLILYASLDAGLGFDIMLKDYGDAHCAGRSGTIGIDGWYANGQTYAYLQGEVGVKVNLWFIKKKIPVVRGAAATLLQAKLPNPSWFAGYLGVKFDLLGGLIKGNIRLKITLGEECEIIMPDGPPLDLGEMIADITPQNRTTGVDVFAAPQAAFNMPVEKKFSLQDANGNNISYRIKLEEFSLKQNGAALPGKLEWNSSKDAVSFLSHDILPPKEQLKALARVRLEEYKNGKWETVKDGNTVFEEVKEITFTTGDAPSTIPASNIEYCYPVMNQRYFHKDETNKAYVQLKRGQAYLFAPDMRHEILLAKGNETYTQPLYYNVAKKCIEYIMPDIKPGSKYSFDIMTYAQGGETAAQPPEKRVTVLSGDDNEVTRREAQAADVLQTDVGESLLSYEFATSAYGTFREKVENVNKKSPSVWKNGEDYILEYAINGGEPFGEIDLAGSVYTRNRPMVDIYAVLNDDYYREDINPLIYSYLLNKGISLKRNDSYGVPPIRAITVSTPYLVDIQANILNNTVKKHFPYIYSLPGVYRRDLNDLRTQEANRYKDNIPESLHNLMYDLFPKIRHGEYETTLRYVFPDGTQGSSAKFEFFNELR